MATDTKKKYKILIVDDDKEGERTAMSYQPMTFDAAMRLISRMHPSGNKWLTVEAV